MIVVVPTHEGNIRILAIGRIRNLVKTTTIFTIPENFELKQNLDTSFGIFVEETISVLIRFSAESAIYTRGRSWGQDQTVVELDNGEIDLAFTAAGFDEIVRWVLSFGKGARVLEPETLVERVKTELEGMAVNYTDIS